MKSILFVCVENSCRSQMAEGFARQMGGSSFNVFSAGSRPSGVVDPRAIKAMAEVGIDIASARSKGFDDLAAKAFDYAVTLGCKDTCPFVPAERHIRWQIEDPKSKDLAFFRKVRDSVRSKVEELISTI